MLPQLGLIVSVEVAGEGHESRKALLRRQSDYRSDRPTRRIVCPQDALHSAYTVGPRLRASVLLLWRDSGDRTLFGHEPHALRGLHSELVVNKLIPNVHQGPHFPQRRFIGTQRPSEEEVR